MKTCIKMSNGNVYVVKMTMREVATRLSAEDYILIPESLTGKDDFYINSLQVCAIYPAKS